MTGCRPDVAQAATGGPPCLSAFGPAEMHGSVLVSGQAQVSVPSAAGTCKSDEAELSPASPALIDLMDSQQYIAPTIVIEDSQPEAGACVCDTDAWLLCMSIVC